MDSQRFVDLGVDLAGGLVRAIRSEHNRLTTPLVHFEDQATTMLLRPDNLDRGSLHYMHFPAGSSQRLHYHPSVRYLIAIGDCDTTVTSGVLLEEGGDPHPRLRSVVLRAGVISALRITTHEWHRFEVSSDGDAGVIAFSVHGDDHLSDQQITSDLMLEVTTFWAG